MTELRREMQAKLTPMQSATIERLATLVPELRKQWTSPRHFPYLIADNFLPKAFAEAIFAAYPGPDAEGWDQTTYTHQRRKVTRTENFPGPIEEFFQLTALPQFTALISQITEVPLLLPDPKLVGGGLHQILRGGFLDTHVDFNFHPQTKQHRRMNLLVYMNKGWKQEYQGFLELWNMDVKKQLENISPDFNRCVIFETNEVSYHGHPKPLVTPQGVTRKSLAIYYYTENRDKAQVAAEHNTIYRQTTGVSGYLKTMWSSLEASMERFRGKGSEGFVKSLGRKVIRVIKGLPPENR